MFRLITDMAFSAMTSNGDIKLTFHIYKLSFLNFLIGMPNWSRRHVLST
jgi:hypothetical protein